MTAIVTDYAKAVRLSQKHAQLHCIYCGLVVGEVVWFKDGREYEQYVNTVKGPVCGACHADPHASKRAERGDTRGKRRAAFRLQVRNTPTGVGRKERDAEIVRMHDDGMTYKEIGLVVGMTKSGASTAAKRARERMG